MVGMRYVLLNALWLVPTSKMLYLKLLLCSRDGRGGSQEGVHRDFKLFFYASVFRVCVGDNSSF